ncbi:hypothetical protein DRO24_00095 [Candidatus Bathyarchaeota archaeon]|nr:MAG: hypothetical protein DRO24_00095 [Candidatus Bathyarchaeota archaeon]
MIEKEYEQRLTYDAFPPISIKISVYVQGEKSEEEKREISTPLNNLDQDIKKFLHAWSKNSKNSKI